MTLSACRDRRYSLSAMLLNSYSSGRTNIHAPKRRFTVHGTIVIRKELGSYYIREKKMDNCLLDHPKEDSMNKLVLARATVAAWPEHGGVRRDSCRTDGRRIDADSVRAIAGARCSQDARDPSGRRKKVVRHHTLHRRASQARHRDRGKKVAVKHMPSKKVVTPKTAS